MMNHKPPARRLLAVIAVGVVALTGACGGDDAATNTDGDTATTASGDSATPAPGGDAKPTSSIAVKDFKFDPSAATVKAGEVVTWTNEDTFNHSIFDKGGAFKGPDFGSPVGTTTFTHTYDKPGTYPYFCGVHNSMTGSITVT